MSKHKLEREEIMAFLLGEMEEAETSRIESMFLADPTYSEAIEAAKSQLYEEYKSGRLTPEQSGRFERRLLPDLEDDKKKFQAMLARNEALRNKADEGEAPAKPSAPPAPKSAAPVAAPEVAPEPASASSSAVPKLAIGAVLAVAIAGGAFFALRGGSEDAASDSAPAAETPTATLPVFSVRGKSQLIVLPPGPKVRLQLPIPAEAEAKNISLTAFLGDAETKLDARAVGDGVETTVVRSELGDGRYDLELRFGESVVGYYSFRK